MEEKIQHRGGQNFSKRPTFRARNFTCAPDRARKMGGQILIESPIETQLETLVFVLYYLNKTCSFHFKYVSIKSFVNEDFLV